MTEPGFAATSGLIAQTEGLKGDLGSYNNINNAITETELHR